MALSAKTLAMLNEQISWRQFRCECGSNIDLGFYKVGRDNSMGLYVVRVMHPISDFDEVYFYNNSVPDRIIATGVLQILRSISEEGFLCEMPAEIEWKAV